MVLFTWNILYGKEYVMVGIYKCFLINFLFWQEIFNLIMLKIVVLSRRIEHINLKILYVYILNEYLSLYSSLVCYFFLNLIKDNERGLPW